MPIIELEQGSSEWKNMRKTKVTATDSSVILCLNPWKSPITLWMQKIGLESEDQVNEAMTRGKNLEEKALEKFNESVGYKMKPTVVIHDQHDWAMASLDGMNDECLVEIKCGGKKLHDMAKNGIIPVYYICQMMHQMFVTGFKEAFYYFFDGENGITIPVKRDDNFISNMIEKELEFYKCMTEFRKPIYE